ncbi:Lecithin:cholesterol acyltransferase-domain-containing protein [Schizophyllum commune]
MTLKKRAGRSKAHEDSDATSSAVNDPASPSPAPTHLDVPDPNLSPDISDPSPSEDADDPKYKKLKHEVRSLKHHHSQKHGPRPWYQTKRVWFPFGILVGIGIASMFVTESHIEEMQASFQLFLDEYGVLPDLPELNFTTVQLEFARLRDSIPEVWKLNTDGREFKVGEEAKARGLNAQHPVVLIPGVISTGLESWSTAPEYRPFFREKVWGGFSMISQVTFNRERWMSALLLDPVTGLDPPDVKVRAAEGINAASSFIQGYWLWSKIVENLAVVNYDTNNLYMAAYDWRLSFYNLEERDGYFSRLKLMVEGLKQRQGKKVVLAAHSMGANVSYRADAPPYSMKWVESPEHGGGGPDWVENHIDSYISIAGTHLGVAKAMAAFLSGEMKDTVQMNPAGAYVLERFFSRKERQQLFRSWAGSASMWLKGGDAVWGDGVTAPDDTPEMKSSFGHLLAFRQLAADAQNNTVGGQDGTGNGDTKDLRTATSPEEIRNMTSEEAGTWILQHTPSTFQKMMETNFSQAMERDEAQLIRNNADHRKWSNPLEVQLPRAPSMKIYCVYGHGKETERSYWYARGSYEHDDNAADSASPRCVDPEDEECQTPRTPLDLPLRMSSYIDAEYSDLEGSPVIRNGVKMGEGDGTVSLLSLGAMCVEGWKRPRWNPAGINVTTVELPHLPVPTIPRGGANTSDHVDILGSTALNEIIVKVATGVGHEVQENFVSNIREYAKRIKWDG